MPITAPIEIVGTDADDIDWVTLADVKEELGIAVLDTSKDVILAKRIARASARLLKFTNLRGVAFRRYEETLPSLGLSVQLMVTRVPIVNFIKLELLDPQQLLDATDGQDFTDTTLVQDPEVGTLYRRLGFGWSAAGATFPLQLTEFADPLPGTEAPVWRVDYEAGWVMPNQTVPAPTGSETPEPFPEDLQLACLQQVVWADRHQNRSEDVKRKKVGDTDLTFTTLGEQGRAGSAAAAARMFGLAPSAFFLVDPYRRAA